MNFGSREFFVKKCMSWIYKGLLPPEQERLLYEYGEMVKWMLR